MTKLITVWIEGEDPIYYLDADPMYDSSDRSLTIVGDDGTYAVWNTDYVVGFSVTFLDEVDEDE